MFERIDYEVARIDGDYAYLRRLDGPEAEEKMRGQSPSSAGDHGRKPGDL